MAKVITKNATLVEARKALELKTEQIAKELGIYASNYSNIENMDIYPGVDLQTRICDFFRSKGVFVLEEELFPEELNYLTKGERPYEPDVVPLDWINKDVLIVNPEEELEKRELKIVVDKVLRSLEAIRPFSDVEMETKGKYEQILRELFGIDTEEYSTKEIGERLELSSTDVRRIRNRALRVLRRPYIAKELRPFYKNN